MRLSQSDISMWKDSNIESEESLVYIEMSSLGSKNYVETKVKKSSTNYFSITFQKIFNMNKITSY
jgi:hypothetical protein